VRRQLKEEGRGRGEAGEAGMRRGSRRRRGEEKGAALEKEEALTCGPHTSAGERERGRGAVGRRENGPQKISWAAGEGRKEGRMGRGLGLLFFFLFFSNPF
jgi:hypothetical protein